MTQEEASLQQLSGGTGGSSHGPGHVWARWL